ncbi:MAG: twin-arginine translocase TatA/TatE family subunit [Muribaculaceae bacterium]|nr:twin-arginine translocase TatA/TatE family subunit [Muribaculaceae bacterium]MBR5744301.1 twin-arginine translocase TatA/TatE family subunit [Muribaculaceae bacterium]
MNTFLTIPLFLGLGNLRGMEWVIIIVAFLLLFGATRIPKLMRNVGKGVRGFKQGLNDMKEEINKPVDEDDNKPEKKEKGTTADNPADK